MADDNERESSPVPEMTSPPPDTPIVDDEDLLDNIASDYKEQPELDQYDRGNIDDSNDIERMAPAQRRAAESMMAGRDRREGRNRRTYIPHALLDDDDAEIPASLLERQRQLLDIGDDEMRVQQSGVNLEDFQGPLREWLDEDRVRREIKRRFKSFLTEFTDTHGNAVYPEKLKLMCQDNGSSVTVSYYDLSNFTAVLAIWLVEQPSLMLSLFDAVTMEVVGISFPGYNSIAPHIHSRISNLPLTDNLRDLRQLHLNSLVQVTGVVTRRTSIFPQLQLVRFDCLKCGFTTSPIVVDSKSSENGDYKPKSCPDCSAGGPFRLNESLTIYRNYQKIVLQESPGSVPAGRIPRSRDVILVDDLCDMVRPGEKIAVTGIYKNIFSSSMNAETAFPVFSTIIEANHINAEGDFYSNDEYTITDEDRHYFTNVLSKMHDLEERIMNECIAPSIYGHDYIKRSICYALFGGQEKRHENKHRVRGDINILILGDPGTAKSQFLKFTEKVAHRSVYATGKGASAVGLTASVRRDSMTGEWTLEGGALVLADRGVCLIDEFDKMNEKDRVSIHEAMEQQSISISKAGIVASLKARCAVIAAANPIRGRYDASLTFVENVDLTDPILSRFDILAVVRDKVDVQHDEMLANFVVGNHMRSHPDNADNLNNEDDDDENMGDDGGDKDKDGKDNGGPKKPVLSQERFKKYILFAKTTCAPRLDNIDRDKIAEFYSELRQKSMQGGGIPIAVRHIESILRISEARAKMYLREYVRSDDVDMAIRTLLESFIATQKQSVQTSLRKSFRPYLDHQRDSNQLLIHLLNEEVQRELDWRHSSNLDAFANLDRSQPIEIETKIFQDNAKRRGININFTHFYRSSDFKNEGFSVNRNKTIITKTI